MIKDSCKFLVPKHGRKSVCPRSLLWLIAAIIICAMLPSSGSSIAFADGNDGSIDATVGDAIAVEDMLDELDMDGLREYFDSLSEEQRSLFGFNFESFIVAITNGDAGIDFTSFLNYLLSSFGAELNEILPILCVMIAVTLLVGMMNAARGNFASVSVGGMVETVSSVAISALALVQIFAAISVTSAFVNNLRLQMEAIFPILLTLMTAVGAAGTVAIYQPAVAAIGFLVSEVVIVVALPLIIASFAFSAIGNMSGAVKLSGFSKMLSSVAKWLLTICFFAFLAFLSVQGITAGICDSVSVRAAKFALGKYVPVIGGYISEGFNVILSGSVTIKNAIGLSAVLITLVSVVPPLLTVICTSLTMRVLSAIAQPIGSNNVSVLAGDLAGGVNILVAILVGVTFLYFIFILLIITSGNLVI